MSRVDNKERLGIYTPKKITPILKKIGNNNAKQSVEPGKKALSYHRKFIKELNARKREEKEKKEAELEQMRQRDQAVS